MESKILLVDDDRNRRDAVQQMLTSNPSVAIVATDCSNALTLLTKDQFDLVLLDITPPDKCGYGVLKYLEETHVASKVMVITGTTGVANIIRSTAPGAREYITKPYKPDDLLKSVEHLLSDRAPLHLKLQIIQAGDFVKSTPSGELDMIASREGLAQIAAAGAELQDYTVLIDLRDVSSRLTTANIYDLALELSKYGETFRRKTAVLARPDKDLHQATFFENAAQNRGFEVRTFTLFENAITWLSNIAPPAAEQ